MGYSTDFVGGFLIRGPIHGVKVDEKTLKLLAAFNHNLDNFKEANQEFEAFLAEMKRIGTLDPNENYDNPYSYNQWVVRDVRSYRLEWQELRWDEVEKFYDYVAWLEHIIKYVFSPRGYVLSGKVNYFGEDDHDMGYIKIEDNVVTHVQAQFDGVDTTYMGRAR